MTQYDDFITHPADVDDTQPYLEPVLLSEGEAAALLGINVLVFRVLAKGAVARGLLTAAVERGEPCYYVDELRLLAENGLVKLLAWKDASHAE